MNSLIFLSLAMQLALILVRHESVARHARLCLSGLALLSGALLAQIVLNFLLPLPPRCGWE